MSKVKSINQKSKMENNTTQKQNAKKSFTLVELMIVIAILAILSAIVIFALNPSELFKKSRDSRRITDIQTLYKGISFMESWNTSGITYGTSTTVYLSLPDSSTTCSSYALPTLPTGYTYNCVTSTNLRKADSNGWIPIDFTVANDNKYITSLPIDPINDINYYYSYNPGGSFEVNALLESNEYITKFSLNDGGDSFNSYENGSSLTDMPLTFPQNWIKVPGNTTYGTSDFYVMQYEAKYSTDGHGASDATDDCRVDTRYDTYDWNKACAYKADQQTNVISSPLGSPIAGVTHNEAKAICAFLGAHLITNQEWMTIARNVEQQSSNWTLGTVGTGYLFNGNSSEVSRGYKAFADRYDVDKGVNRNQRAVFTLSNGSQIYDFSGNVWEHTMVDINDTLLDNLPNSGGESGWRWVELSSLTTYGDFQSFDDLCPTNFSWNANKGMGRVSTNVDLQSDRVLRRGGDFGDSSYAGAYAMGLDWNSTGHSAYDVGFRCAR